MGGGAVAAAEDLNNKDVNSIHIVIKSMLKITFFI
jgi:hypothetical protein